MTYTERFARYADKKLKLKRGDIDVVVYYYHLTGHLVRYCRDISEFWAKARTFIDEAMEKRNQSVSIYFNPETGISINTYPWPDAETLWEMYQNGQITASDFRTKMGLPMVKNPEQFMMRGFLDQELQMPKKGENGNV